MCSHIEHKKNRWYYRRRIPADVRKLHIDPKTRRPKAQIYFSLETDDKALACKKADTETRRLDALWQRLREGGEGFADPAISLARLKAAGLAPGDGRAIDDEGLSLPQIDDFREMLIGFVEQGSRPAPISAQDKLTLDILHGAPVPKTLEDARELYRSLGKGPKNKIALGQWDRAWEILFSITGNKTITDLRRSEANEFVAKLLAKGNGGETIRKYVAQINPVLKLAIREFELGIESPFQEIVIPNRDEGPRRVTLPYTEEELERIKVKCHQMDDPYRWLILALMDSGCRLSEFLGMEQQDIHLDAPIPYVLVRQTETRGLKTDASTREVPLMGQTLWAVRRAVQQGHTHLFPTLLPKALGADFTSKDVSNALLKWMRENGLRKDGQVLHSFRHTMADRLRNAGVSKELIEAIAGWTTKGMSARYGKGFNLEAKRDALSKVIT